MVYYFLILWSFLPGLPQGRFDSNMDQARTGARNQDWRRTADLLDAAKTADPALFEANNLHYLRGRAAENLKDWQRAAQEFDAIAEGTALRPLAAWHTARAALHLGSTARAEAHLTELPADFPSDLLMQLAAEAPQELALRIYGPLNSRSARFARARILKDTAAMWVLLHDRNSDDVALECARQLAAIASTTRELMDVGNAFLAQRAFDEAVPFFQRASQDPAFAAEAWYQRARVYFLTENYAAAVDTYRTVSNQFPGTDWQRDAEYQIASCYWRMARYPDAAKAYMSYITRFHDRADDGATRNLVDVYRVSGENAKAVDLINRKLAGKVSTATRQALLLVKAKILFSQDHFAAARDIFRQLGTMRMVNTPGGATIDEVHYFEALSQSKLGNTTAAKNLWKALAEDPLSYFGQKAVERLGGSKEMKPSAKTCATSTDAAVSAATERMAAITRPVRTEIDVQADAVADLVFMRLWDEAFLWLDRGRRIDARNAADLAYLADRYDRAITYGDRLPESDMAAWPFVYPAAYRPLICAASTPYAVDPLWLHAIIWQESKYNTMANSAASARGLMQFIPETERAVGERIGLRGLTPDRLYDPEISIRLGATYWSELLKEFKLPELALAAYNGGPDNVRRWRSKLPNADVEFFVSDIGFPETKHYVQAVFRARAAYGRNE